VKLVEKTTIFNNRHNRETCGLSKRGGSNGGLGGGLLGGLEWGQGGYSSKKQRIRWGRVDPLDPRKPQRKNIPSPRGRWYIAARTIIRISPGPRW